MNPDLKEMYDGNPTVKRIVDFARALEGAPRHVGTHAAGIVISKESLSEYVPLYASDTKDGRVISTQFNMTTIEELGLLKMDFLGLRNLTVIQSLHAPEFDWIFGRFKSVRVQLSSSKTVRYHGARLDDF